MSFVNFFTAHPQPADRLARLITRGARAAGLAWGLAWAWVLALALTTVITGCSSPPQRNALPAPTVTSRLSADDAKSVTVYAIGLVGTPYRWGGNTPESGFDCSGLIAHVYQKSARIQAPRTVADLKSWGAPLSAHELRSGDVVLFSKGGEPTHAGIYVGDGRFVHAPSTGGRVRLDRLQTPYWSSYQVAYNRP
jgi:cell wall-associated NlpC family hydrolase